MSNKKPHKEIPAVTVPIYEIISTVEQIYDGDHEIRSTCYDTYFIENSAGELIAEFKSYTNLCMWHFEQQDVLDERRKEALKQQGYIED